MLVNKFDFPIELSHYRLKHFGWDKEADHIVKYNRYIAFDPNGIYGSLAQYRSILDSNPELSKREEDE